MRRSLIAAGAAQLYARKIKNYVLCYSGEPTRTQGESSTPLLSERKITRCSSAYSHRWWKNWVPTTADQERLEMIHRAVRRNVLQRRDQDASAVLDWNTFERTWIKNLCYLDKLCNGRSSDGNHVTLLVGEQIIPELLKTIERAKRCVWIETYIFDKSSVAERFVSALLDAKARGADVVLVIDWLGSFDMPSKWIQMLEQAGIPVVVSNDWTNIGFRNHCKLAVIDDIGFCGSANIAIEAAPKLLEGTHTFFDIHVRVEGPAVHHMNDLFCETLLQQNKLVIRRSPLKALTTNTKPNCGAFVQVLDSNAKRKRRCIQSAYHRIINNASLSVYATAGYFVPPPLLYWSLKRVIRKQIPFTLILSGNSDVWGDVYAATYSASKLLKTPLKFKRVLDSCRIESTPLSPRIAFTQSHHCHAKTLVVDGLFSAVGSFNFDRHSGRRNMDAVLAIVDTNLANQLHALYEAIENNRCTEADKGTPNMQSQPATTSPTHNPSFPFTIPTSYPLTLQDWYQYPFIQRVAMRVACWLMNISASPLFDGFDDVDGEAKKRKRHMKWNVLMHKANHSFYFGPSRASLDIYLLCL